MSILEKIEELKELFDSDCKKIIKNQSDIISISNKYLGRKGLLNTLYPNQNYQSQLLKLNL